MRDRIDFVVDFFPPYIYSFFPPSSNVEQQKRQLDVKKTSDFSLSLCILIKFVCLCSIFMYASVCFWHEKCRWIYGGLVCVCFEWWAFFQLKRQRCTSKRFRIILLNLQLATTTTAKVTSTRWMMRKIECWDLIWIFVPLAKIPWNVHLSLFVYLPFASLTEKFISTFVLSHALPLPSRQQLTGIESKKGDFNDAAFQTQFTKQRIRFPWQNWYFLINLTCHAATVDFANYIPYIKYRVFDMDFRMRFFFMQSNRAM